MISIPRFHLRRVRLRPRAGRLASSSLAVIALVLAPAGCCKCWNWRGDGFADNSGSFAQKMRPPADESKFSGLDARSREIERDLGVR
jgi:hypothetical protein